MRCILLLIATLLTGACAPMLAPPFGAAAHMRPARYQRPEPPIVGRWDNVIALRPGTIISVIAADGIVHTGTFARAALRSLHLQVSGAPVDLLRADVLRIDVLPGGTGASVEGDIAVGAVKGALGVGGLLMAIPYLATGDVIVPPARFWGLGAVLGGMDAAGKHRVENRQRTVYVAPELVGSD